MDRLPIQDEGTLASSLAVDCYVRASAPGMLVDDIVDRVRTDDEEGLFEECTVDFWPNEVCLTRSGRGTAVLSHYQEFRAWADEEAVSLEPAFTRCERTSVVSGKSETVLVLPVLCLAVRVDGELAVVAPHTTGTTPYTVGDALADVEALSRPESGGVESLPPEHPIRSALTARATGDQSAEQQMDKMI